MSLVLRDEYRCSHKIPTGFWSLCLDAKQCILIWSSLAGPIVYLVPGSMTLTCGVFCQGLAGDGRRRLLQGVRGGGGRCAGAGVVACHVGWRVRWAVVILSVLPLTKGRITVVVLLWETDWTLVGRKTELFEHWSANLDLKIKGERQKGDWRDVGIDILHQCRYFTVEIQKHKCKHMSVPPYIWTMLCLTIYLYLRRYSLYSWGDIRSDLCHGWR